SLPALGFSYTIEENWYARLASQPEVVAVEPYVYGLAMWHRQDGSLEQCYIVGTSMGENAIGTLLDITPRQRVELGRVGPVGLYDPDRKLLGLEQGVGAIGEINSTRVEVVAILQGRSRAAGLMPGLVCSLRTAHRLLPGLRPEQTTYLVARCR